MIVDFMDRWLDIIVGACVKISSLLPDNVSQIVDAKEKIGLYTGGASIKIVGKIDDLIDMASDKSYFICEKCGSKDGLSLKRVDDFWLKATCDGCN